MTKENKAAHPLKAQVAEKLKSLKPEITTADRKAYIKADKFSKVGLSGYLNGRVFDVDRGIRMMEFFEKRIKARAQRAAKSIAA